MLAIVGVMCYQLAMIRIFQFLAFTLAATSLLAQKPSPPPVLIIRNPRSAELEEKPWEKLSDTNVSPVAVKALAINPSKWKHGETEHFIIHYIRSGDMIARRSEKFYNDIREFFGNRKDRMAPQKSHIFAFYDEADWTKFKSAAGLSLMLAGVTIGREFFYQPFNQQKQFDSLGKVQAHEMTHLVFNRFFDGVPPLWLNEGVSEYFGLKKTSDITTFRRTVGAAAPFGIDNLFETNTYPDGQEAVQSFYAEAAIVVDFLTQTADRRVLLPKFIDSMITDGDLDAALKLYGFKTRDEFKKAYARHRMLFPKH
jgi:hypothetical protein